MLMKKSLFAVLLLLLSSLADVAQAQPDSINAKQKRFYIGVELSSISYSMWNQTKMVGGGFTPVAHAQAGYRLTKRMNVQVGLTYGRDKESALSGTYYGYGDTILYYNHSRNNYGVTVPITVQFTPFNPYKKLQIYAAASFIPIFGAVNQQESETYEDVTTVTHVGKDSGVYAIATAGIQLNYKISNRFEGFGKVNLLYKNVGQYSEYAKQAKSLAIGLNYNF